MPTKPVKKSDKHNKHTEVTAANFRRIAKAIRQVIKAQGLSSNGTVSDLARIFDAEAKLLRSMR